MSNIYNYTYDNSSITIEYTINSLLNDNTINKESTIISCGIGNNMISLAKYLNKLNIKGLIVLPDDCDNNIVDTITNLNIDIIKSPYQFGFDNMIDLCNDLKLEIENSYFLNLIDNKYASSSHFKTIGKEIVKNYEFDIAIIPIGSGCTIKGLSKIIKMKTEALVIGIHIKNHYNYTINNFDEDFIDDIVVYDNISLVDAINIEVGKYKDKNIIIIN